MNDYLALFSSKIDIKLNPILVTYWNQLIDKTKSWEIGTLVHLKIKGF